VQSTAITSQMELQQRNHPPSAAYKKATAFLKKNWSDGLLYSPLKRGKSNSHSQSHLIHKI